MVNKNIHNMKNNRYKYFCKKCKPKIFNFLNGLYLYNSWTDRKSLLYLYAGDFKMELSV